MITGIIIPILLIVITCWCVIFKCEKHDDAEQEKYIEAYNIKEAKEKIR